MLHGKDYAPCTECGAENITSRGTCWNCGHTMPYTVNDEGKTRVPNEKRVVSRSEITKLLDQAELIVCEDETSPPSSTQKPESLTTIDTSFATRVQRWLFGARNPA